MNVLLINPPKKNIIRESLLPVVEDDTGVYPPLGLLYVAAHSENIENCNLKVLDCQASGVDYPELSRIINEFKPDVVGIQAMTFTLIDASMTAKAVKQYDPGVNVVFGGPHPTIYPVETLGIPEVDAVIYGEGEFAFASLIKSLVNGDDIENVDGVVTRNNTDQPRQLSYIQDLDILQHPARHLVDATRYKSPIAISNPLTTIMSSRGCPGKCVFCDRPQMGKIFRKRSAGSVVDEMKLCVNQFGINEFLFYDDTFTISKSRVFEICEMIIENRMNVHWDVRARVDTMSPEMISRMKDAGCHRIHYGIESASPKIQKRLKKNIDIERAHEIFAYTRKTGIEVLGYFMIGNPDEEMEDIKQTLEMVKTLPMDYMHMGIFTPYPGTEIYRESLDTGFYDTDYWKTFAMNPDRDFIPRFYNQHFTDSELMKILKRAHAGFYARPSYIISNIFKLRSFDEFKRKALLGIKLLYSVFSR